MSVTRLEQANLTTAILAVGTGVLSYYCWCSLCRPSRAPPGPIHIPLVGNNVFTGSRDINIFANISKTYGKIYSIYMGQK